MGRMKEIQADLDEALYGLVNAIHNYRLGNASATALLYELTYTTNTVAYHMHRGVLPIPPQGGDPNNDN